MFPLLMRKSINLKMKTTTKLSTSTHDFTSFFSVCQMKSIVIFTFGVQKYLLPPYFQNLLSSKHTSPVNISVINRCPFSVIPQALDKVALSYS